MPETSSARMPDAPVADCEKGKGIVNHQHDWEHLSAEEKHAAEESFSVYCKPVEFYNFLQHRANQYPLFLQRCLDYMIKAKRKKRIPLTVSLSWNDDETQSLFPLCICLARLDRNDEAREGAKKYQAIRISTIHSSSKIDGNGNTEVQAKFVLPELEKLHEQAKSSKFYVFIFASVENPISLSEVNANMRPWDVASNECGEICLYGKISMKNLHWIWDMYPKIPMDQLIRIQCRINLLPCILMYCFQRKSKSISILDSRDFPDERDLKQLQVTLFVRKLEDTEKSSYDTQANREVGSSSSLSNIHRLKQGNVAFNYRYYNNTLQKVEVTEDFSCPFCLVKCATFKGLRCHLSMSHDHFNYEFLELEDIPSVNVSVKTNIWKPEIIGHGVDPRIQTYIFCGKRPKRRDQSLLESEILASDTELLEKHDGSNAIVLHPGPDCVPPVSYQDHGTAAVLQVDQEGVSNAIVLHPDLDCVPPVSDHDHGMPAALQVDQEGVSNAIILHPGPYSVPPISEHDNGTPAVPQVDKRSKLTVERRDPKIVGKLKKRRFYHSHKYQVMALEEVILDDDSEDEINEHAQEIEDRRKVSLLDATNDEKQFIPMWNTFVKKHRVLAEGHINWAFEAFTKYHCADIAQSPALTWRWKAFMIKLSNHGLLKARTLITCNILLEQYRKLNSDISQQLKKFQF